MEGTKRRGWLEDGGGKKQGGIGVRDHSLRGKMRRRGETLASIAAQASGLRSFGHLGRLPSSSRLHNVHVAESNTVRLGRVFPAQAAVPHGLETKKERAGKTPSPISGVLSSSGSFVLYVSRS